MSVPEDLQFARRLAIVSRTNGLSSSTIALIALGISIAAGDRIAILAAAGMCAGAAMEVTGSVLAAKRDERAPRILAASQAVALTSALCLVARCWVAIPPAPVLARIPAHWRDSIAMMYPAPGEAEAFTRLFIRLALSALACVAAIFESGMAVFYARGGRGFRAWRSSKTSGQRR